MKTYKQFVAEANKSREIHEGWGLAANWALRGLGAGYAIHNLTKPGLGKETFNKNTPEGHKARVNALLGAAGATIPGPWQIPAIAATAIGARETGLAKPITNTIKSIPIPYKKEVSGVVTRVRDTLGLSGKTNPTTQKDNTSSYLTPDGKVDPTKITNSNKCRKPGETGPDKFKYNTTTGKCDKI